MKVAINCCYGGFSVSRDAIDWLREMGFQPALDESLPRAKKTVYDDGEMNDGKLESEWYDNTSPSEVDEYLETYEWNSYLHYNDPVVRSAPLLIQCIELMGERANGEHAEIAIVEIPDDVNFEIDEYDGMESIHEAHRSWY